jgi:hypothetical protein
MNAQTRNVGALLLLAGLAEFALLAFHPASHAHDFAGMLREEAANRGSDAIVHGGFVFVLAMQLACFAVLSVRLANSAAVFGLSLFAIGSAFLMMSVTIDGLIVPSVALRYAAETVDTRNAVRGVFAFAGAAIGWLMPMGSALQGLGITAWGLALTKSSRPISAVALLIGILIFSAPAIALAMANSAGPVLAMAGIVGGGLWAMMGGAWLLRCAR